MATERINIKSTDISFFEDINGTAYFVVMAWDADGREYALGDATYPILPMPFPKASKLKERVADRGSIDPDLWACRTPYGTNAWLLDGCEERQIEDERDAA
jgi:hypothetical protein